MECRIPVYAKFNGKEFHVGDFELDVTMVAGTAVVDCGPLAELLEKNRSGSTTWRRGEK